MGLGTLGLKMKVLMMLLTIIVHLLCNWAQNGLELAISMMTAQTCELALASSGTRTENQLLWSWKNWKRKGRGLVWRDNWLLRLPKRIGNHLSSFSSTLIFLR
ncbi:hypothetical protein POM88_046187 [Heracleum sosnowskyi]|uniref:Secreted protein n=1 Tax=Heracleum sosnowskyi TaxID=360622 RepID=A0AAD8M760_9APIA|nr:hypothetical protein POM88_046187 [Heracleum sosnowskyi]